jgi:hypothetical protein
MWQKKSPFSPHQDRFPHLLQGVSKGVTQIYSTESFKQRCHIHGNGAQSETLCVNFLHAFIRAFKFLEKRGVHSIEVISVTFTALF